MKNDPGEYRPTDRELEEATDLMRAFADTIKLAITRAGNPLYNATLLALMNMLLLLLTELRKAGPHQEAMVPKSMRHFAKRLLLLADAPNAAAMEQLLKDTSDLQRKH